MKPGTEYELFVKEVYEYLNRASGLTDVVIKHNVVLTGISGIPRQIDVFWSFKRAGIPYKVAIECKDYSRSVSIEKISAFHDVLNDLGDVKGIFATRAGFQTGAIEWARKYGIQPMIICHPTEEDWTGRIKDIHLQFEITSIENIRPQIIVNKEKSLGMEIPDGFHGFSDSVTIQFDELTTIDGKTIENESVTMQDLIHILPTEYGPSQNNTYSFKFTNGILQGKYPVDEVIFTYDVCLSTDHTAIYGDRLIMAIVKNITEGTETLVDRFGRVSERQPLTQ